LPRIVSNTENAVAERGQYDQGERLQDQVSSEMNRIKQTVVDHLPTSAMQAASPARMRFASTTRWGFVALLILLALGVPASADDPIAEWLKQDEVDSQIDKVRPDLNALTDQQLQDIFKIGREQVDNHQLIERGGEDHKPVLYIWVIAITVGIAAMIAAVKARPLVRTQLRTLLIPVNMKDQG